MRPEALHIIADFWFDSDFPSIETLRRIADKAVKRSGLTEVYTVDHEFEPYGYSLIIQLKESHLAFHTYPEANYIALDVFGCGSFERVIKAYEVILDSLKPVKVKELRLIRGELHENWREYKN